MRPTSCSGPSSAPCTTGLSSAACSPARGSRRRRRAPRRRRRRRRRPTRRSGRRSVRQDCRRGGGLRPRALCGAQCRRRGAREAGPPPQRLLYPRGRAAEPHERSAEPALRQAAPCPKRGRAGQGRTLHGMALGWIPVLGVSVDLDTFRGVLIRWRCGTRPNPGHRGADLQETTRGRIWNQSLKMAPFPSPAGLGERDPRRFKTGHECAECRLRFRTASSKLVRAPPQLHRTASRRSSPALGRSPVRRAPLTSLLARSHSCGAEGVRGWSPGAQRGTASWPGSGGRARPTAIRNVS
mmetsp:Transcript_45889/g.142024  ORF Transcript_45889/g.142024 Transcript_45889/m.142024 type:complete len:296 (+) Transcript_45889:1579-2466(+)